MCDYIYFYLSIVNFLFSNNCSFFSHFPIFLQLISQLFLVMTEFLSSKIQQPGVKKKVQIISRGFLGEKMGPCGHT